VPVEAVADAPVVLAEGVQAVAVAEDFSVAPPPTGATM
jgi:hypothetical protein